MVYWQRLSTLFLSMLMAVLLAGCGTTEKVVDSGRELLNLDTRVALALEADESLNLDADERPSPLVIRIFKLADDRQFQREDFLTLYEDAGERLGRDLLGEVKLREIAPGEKRLETLELSAEVRFLGVMAEYSRYTETNNLLVLPVKAHSGSEYKISASQYGLKQP
ncbi:type VI secretion system lipoprotein TssJ [Endozoicomonas lisbonensis]|uniref:Type VI secretion system protein VasD n=1 Tax=Endozoicomonas lisbonensis TaxID=3120522 RepID=A0ABV2SAR1_9GAMM